MKTLILLSFFAFLTSCNKSTIIKLQPDLKKESGLQTITIEEVKTTIEYFGDYWFHDFDQKLLPNAAPGLLEELQSKHNKGAEILFASHTTVPPYFSSVGILHDTKIGTNKEIVKMVTERFAEDENISNFESLTFGTKAGNFVQLTYNRRHPELKTQAHYFEYLGNLKNRTMRIVFWTLDSRPFNLKSESEKIMKTLNMQWY